MRVSRQPGDNYRVLAAFLPAVYNGFTARQTDCALARILNCFGNEPANENASAVQTPNILTVWRTLHVEVDSMGAVAGNTVTGQITVD